MTKSRLQPEHISDPALYREMYRIRFFEDSVLENFQRGVFFGTTHTYLGQEANAVGILSLLQDEDIVVSNHRCHGHFLAYGGDMRALFAELMGKETGVCGGRGGSQHIHWRNFYSNGVQGGAAPLATGIALAEKMKGNDKVTVCFLGDGTMGQGVVYEAMNMASLWKAPVLFVLENNQIAQTTPVKNAASGSFAERFLAFGIPVKELDTSDVLEILTQSLETLAYVRETASPYALILNTCRFGPHSKGDDTRLPEVVLEMRTTRDPLVIHGKRLSLNQRSKIEELVNVEVHHAFDLAQQDPYPSPSTLFTNDKQ